MAWSQSSKLERYKYFLKVSMIKANPKCFFCKKPIGWEWIYPKLSGNHKHDDIVIHHVNGHHSDWSPKNLKWAHKSCHGRYNWKHIKQGKGKGECHA